MYNALDVARFMINESDRREISLTNEMLQILLYFLQSYSLGLKETKEPFFQDDLVATTDGVIVPSVYYEYLNYQDSPIPYSCFYYELDDDKMHVKRKFFKESVFPEEDKRDMIKVLVHFTSYPLDKLKKVVYNQSPWFEAYHSNDEEHIITKKALQDFFITC